jgi:hypothetical protein
MKDFYVHGKINCQDCFDTCVSSLDENWHLENNPSYWGSSNPKVLILGYSKGATQMNEKDFDKIAFKGMRNRLKEILVLLKLVDKDINIDTLFSKNEKTFGIASIIRCGISKDNKTSGDLIIKSFKNDASKSIINNCTKKFLKENIPSTVERVILLGSSKMYKKLLMKQFEELFDSFKKLDEDNFFTEKIKWTFVAHPSPANAHFKKWIENNKCSL